MGNALHGLDPRKLKVWVAVAVAAMALLLLSSSLFSPGPASQAVAPSTSPPATDAGGGQQSAILHYQQQLQDSVQAALSGIRGVGRVRVAIALHGGPSYLYVFNQTSRMNRSGAGASSSQDTTTENQLATAGTSQAPVLTQELAPKVTGALIIASGAGDPFVRQELMAAAQALLGLPAYEIQVLAGEGGY